MTRLTAVLGLALAATAAPAFAASQETTTVYVAPAPDDYYAPPAATYYYVPSASGYYYPPSATTVYYEPPIVVTAPPATSDELVNDAVVDTLANDSRLSGRIGSDTFNGNVTLNGRVGTPFQAQLAEQDARSVDGVNDVDNRIRPVVGEH
jgi:BON domain-containing protein